MRIRSTKPEFWRSRTVARVDWAARLVLKGLESYVDDNGVGKDDVALIVGDVFPRDMLASPSDTVARVSEAVRSLHQAGLIWRYEVEGTPLLYVSSWESIQRIDKPGKGRYPRPDGTTEYGESVIRESVASPRETVAPGTGEQGNRGTGEDTHVRPDSDSPTEAVKKTAKPRPAVAVVDPDGFADFWATYPRKHDKGHARTAYTKALARTDSATILEGAQRYAASTRDTEPRYIAMPATWLNGERWADETKQPGAPQGQQAPKSSWDRVPNITELRLAGKL